MDIPSRTKSHRTDFLAGSEGTRHPVGDIQVHGGCSWQGTEGGLQLTLGKRADAPSPTTLEKLNPTKNH